MKQTTIKTIRREFNKLKKELHIPDLKYILQEDSTDDHLKQHYNFQISGFSARLAPISFFSEDEDDLVKQVKEKLNKLQFDEIEIAWLKSYAEEFEKLTEQYKQYAKDAENRLLVEGSTNDIRKPYNEDENKESE